MKEENKQKKPGRKPKLDPANIRYSVSFNETEHARFLNLFEQTKMAAKAHFIKSCIFDKPIKVVKIDKMMSDYVMKLSQFHSQYRSIGNNYNQIVKALKTNFSERKALELLYKLEQVTIELVGLSKKIIQSAKDFEQRFLSE